MTNNTTTRIYESKDINAIRDILRANGFECVGTRGWLRGNEPGFIGYADGLWFTVITG